METVPGKKRRHKGILSHEDILDEQALERDLHISVEEENYAKAAKIREKLRILQEDSKVAVLAANTCFYNAFKDGDLAAMRCLLGKKGKCLLLAPCCRKYLIMILLWKAGSLYVVLIKLKNVEVHVRDGSGHVTCMKVVKTKGISWGKQVATNVFDRIDRQWFLCVHHASQVDL